MNINVFSWYVTRISKKITYFKGQVFSLFVLKNFGYAVFVFYKPTSGAEYFKWNKTDSKFVLTSKIDVEGEVRCDSLRIDGTPTAEVNTATHYITISINGTDYKVLLKS